MKQGIKGFLKGLVWPYEDDNQVIYSGILEKCILYRARYSFRTRTLETMYIDESCRCLSECSELDKLLSLIKSYQTPDDETDLRVIRILETLSYQDECSIFVTIDNAKNIGIGAVRCIFRYSGITAKELDIWIENVSCDILGRRIRQAEYQRDMGFLTHDIRNALAAMMFDLQKNDINEIKKGIGAQIRYISSLCEDDSEGSAGVDSADIEELFSGLSAVARNHAQRNSRIIEITSKNISKWKSIGCSFVIIRRCMDNLISNALKYSGENSKIRVKFIVVETPSMRCEFHLYVTDNGIGIKQSNIDQIFKRGFREIRNSSEGRGYGLSILKEHLDRAGGKIEVESIEGMGSTFHVTLPVVLFDWDDEEEKSENGDPADLHIKGDVIIADDEEANIRYFSSLYGKMAGESLAIECYSWDEVLEEFGNSEEGSYSAIFADLNMIGATSAEDAVNSIRASKRSDHNVPVILVTGDKQPGWSENHSGIMFLGKPYSERDLGRILQNLRGLADE